MLTVSSLLPGVALVHLHPWSTIYHARTCHMPHALPRPWPGLNVLVLDMIEGLKGRHGSNTLAIVEARQRQPGQAGEHRDTPASLAAASADETDGTIISQPSPGLFLASSSSTAHWPLVLVWCSSCLAGPRRSERNRSPCMHHPSHCAS